MIHNGDISYSLGARLRHTFDIAGHRLESVLTANYAQGLSLTDRPISCCKLRRRQRTMRWQ